MIVTNASSIATRQRMHNGIHNALSDSQTLKDFVADLGNDDHYDQSVLYSPAE